METWQIIVVAISAIVALLSAFGAGYALGRSSGYDAGRQHQAEIEERKRVSLETAAVAAIAKLDEQAREDLRDLGPEANAWLDRWQPHSRQS